MASEARDKLITAATESMLRHGYSATGIDRICSDAGVSKGAFYHSFRSKEELALAALARFYDHGVAELRSIDVGDAAPAERLPLFVERLAERAELLWRDGCLIGGLATEMAATSDELQREVARQLDALTTFVAALAAPYVKALGVRGVTATSLAQDLLAFVEGTIVLARGHRDPQLLQGALRRQASLLRALAGARPTPRKRSRRD